MCLDNFERTRDSNQQLRGYKVFTKSITPGKYRGVHFTFGGGYHLNETYRETNTGLVADGDYPKGFHIFKSYSAAKMYISKPNEVIIEVRYTKTLGEGYENDYPVALAREMTLMWEA
jgi:hypothetical protein